MSNDLIILPPADDLPALFTNKEKLDKILEAIAAEARSHVPDLSSDKGRKAVASKAHWVSRSKTALDAAGKGLTEQWRRQTALVNEERKRITEQLDKLRDEVRQPLNDWEEAEEIRIAEHGAAIERITALGDCRRGGEVLKPAKALKILKDMTIDVTTFEEFEADAFRAVFAATKKLETLIEVQAQLAAEQKRAAAERAELEKLRAEEAARQEEARQAEAARIAEERRVAAEKAEAERQAQIERDREAAAAKAKADAEAKAKRDAEEAEARHQRELAQAKADAERAAQAERDRIAREQKAEADAKAKREANKRHRVKIQGEIEASLVELIGHTHAKLVAEAVMQGTIPNVEVKL